MILTFGKYNGYDISDSKVPTSYLLWCFENFDSDEYTEKHIWHEIQRRLYVAAKDKNMQVSQPQAQDTNPSKDIKSIFRILAMKYHPDKGGSNESMTAINEFYELINNP